MLDPLTIWSRLLTYTPVSSESTLQLLQHLSAKPVFCIFQFYTSDRSTIGRFVYTRTKAAALTLVINSLGSAYCSNASTLEGDGFYLE